MAATVPHLKWQCSLVTVWPGTLETPANQVTSKYSTCMHHNKCCIIHVAQRISPGFQSRGLTCLANRSIMANLNICVERGIGSNWQLTINIQP